MKSSGFILLGLVLCANIVFAQDESPNEKKRSKLKSYVCSKWSCLDYNKSKIGFRGGLNGSLVAGADVDNKYLKTGYHGGVFVKGAIRPSFAIQPEINYAQKPIRIKITSPGQRGTGVVMLDYLEIPLLGVYNITEFVNMHFGIYTAFLVNSKPLSMTNPDHLSLESDADLNYYDTFDWGGVVGVGYERTSWAAGLRYVQGVTDVGEAKPFTNKKYHISNGINSVAQLYISLTY